MLLRLPDSGRIWFAILLVGASQVPQENTRKTAYLMLRQQHAVVLQLLLSAFLTRWAEPRHATFVSLSPSKPFRPQTLDYNYISGSQDMSISASIQFSRSILNYEEKDVHGNRLWNMSGKRIRDKMGATLVKYCKVKLSIV
jgi:hypothetical protein